SKAVAVLKKGRWYHVAGALFVRSFGAFGGARGAAFVVRARELSAALVDLARVVVQGAGAGLSCVGRLLSGGRFTLLGLRSVWLVR
ncbi:MAG: hypothetical protein V4529_16840, partial [Gemmatimonadota bacterium]